MLRKVLFRLCFLLVAVVLSTSPVFADLINNGDGTITDTDLGLMWLQSPGTDATFANADTWAQNLVFAGYDDWRLPTASNFTTGLPDTVWYSVNNEFGYLYGTELGNPANLSDITPFLNYNPIWYWTGTTDPNNSNNAFAFFWSFDGLWLNQSTLETTNLHVTAVRDITPQAVPEPSIMILLAAGVPPLWAIRRLMRR